MSGKAALHEKPPARPSPKWVESAVSPWRQYLIAAVAVWGVTLPFFLLAPLAGPRAVALLYLLVVVVMALFLGRGATLLAATMSALLWDFFFLPPVTTFRIGNIDDDILFSVYFVVVLVAGQLTARVAAKEKDRRQGEERATALYKLARDLAGAATLDQMLQKVANQMDLVFGAKIAVLLLEPRQGLSFQAHPASTYGVEATDHAVADWVYQNGRPAGRFALHKPESRALFMPLEAGGRVTGVLGLNFAQPTPLTPQQRELLEAFSQHIAMALDWHRLRAEASQTELLAESERLSKTLLNSVSHEIRTPLSAIKSAASGLIEFGPAELSAPRQQMVAEIQEATERLDRLVGKVMDITRLESGMVKPNPSPCDLGDLVHVALKSTKGELALHPVAVELPARLPLVRADFVLLQHSVMNLLANAGAHTPPGTRVLVSVVARNGFMELSVLDRGPGFPPAVIPRLFDKFYRAPGAATGGTGLGLSLVKGFVEAQGGRVTAGNRDGGGAVFTISLPLHEPVRNP